MMFTRLVALAALLPALVSATLEVTQPTGAGWVGNTTVLISWIWNATDPNFSCELGNDGIRTGPLKSGPIAIANNVVPNTGSLSVQLPVVPPGNNYWIKLVKVDNINTVYAQSPLFAITNNPTSSSVTSTSTGSVSGSRTSTILSTTLKTNSSSTESSTSSSLHSTSTGTSSSESITSLQISTLSTSTTPTSTRKSAATPRMDIALGWNAASLAALGGAMLGAVILV
ncbi:uncharacterized protein EI90DRAFT_3288816 [Cantharellus anzutake]|uniref:uncharacterized protein n=1 Tax=Cantharellus anzutake TaxID=1750568 RepID=UPI001905D959|nr:uncharacterized protein EI90DRAFT_3289722 [Cantharellus anzutake]XP_038917406.1 uncharacterized protein EI90DRAFT_3288816 [Cantharellus anzutake]KAF8330871.1 hypothetical protein EI90DRAFT_3289722 [Cantharellus anzutake]KAF8333253.1 hypothetical protein EI90DRAFT_3288816 [Cantharellus anzutake]